MAEMYFRRDLHSTACFANHCTLQPRRGLVKGFAEQKHEQALVLKSCTLLIFHATCKLCIAFMQPMVGMNFLSDPPVSL